MGRDGRGRARRVAQLLAALLAALACLPAGAGARTAPPFNRLPWTLDVLDERGPGPLGIGALTDEPATVVLRRGRRLTSSDWSRSADGVRVFGRSSGYLRYRSRNGKIRFLGLQMPTWRSDPPRRVPLLVLVPPSPSKGAPTCQADSRKGVIGTARVDGVLLSQARGVIFACPQATSVRARSGVLEDVRPFANPDFVEDIARMPLIVDRALRRLGAGYRVDPGRVYLLGGSGGGYPVLLALARHPKLARGAFVYDSMARVSWRLTETDWLARLPGIRGTLRSEGLLDARGGFVLDAIARRDPATPATLDALARTRTRLILSWSPYDPVVPGGDASHLGWLAAQLADRGRPTVLCRHRGAHSGQFRADGDADLARGGRQRGSPQRWGDALSLIGLGPQVEIGDVFCPALAEAVPVR